LCKFKGVIRATIVGFHEGMNNGELVDGHVYGGKGYRAVHAKDVPFKGILSSEMVMIMK
jgi:hypothetical protein